MDKFSSNDIRNVAIVSHVGTGKTSLSDAIAYNGGLNSRIGKVDEGSSFFDYDPEEIKRKTTLSSSFASFIWKNKKINIIDTPGAAEFSTEAKSTLQAADSAIVVIDSTEGMKLQSKKIIEVLEQQKMPYSIFINKLDRESSNFKHVYTELKKSLGDKLLLMQLPMGEGCKLTGIVDILKLKAFGHKLGYLDCKAIDIPDELAKEVKTFKDYSVETILECDDALLEKYLNGEKFSEEELMSALKKGILSHKIVPLFIGSAHKNIGIEQLMNFLIESMPSPLERESIFALNQNNEFEQVILSENAELTGLVVKTLSDVYSGQFSIVRLFSGILHPDEMIYNSSQSTKEKINHIHSIHGKKNELVDGAVAGDIIALPKLKNTHTGDSLSSEKKPMILPFIKMPEPVLSYAIKSKQKNEEDKIYIGFKKLIEEDPAIHIQREEQTKQMILSGMGQVHLDVAANKLQRKFGVDVILESPQIPYRETFTHRVKVQGKYKKQSGGKGQYGDCWIEFIPLERGKGFEFVDNVVGGAIPKQYISAIEAGIKEAMKEGILSGHPVVDIRAVVYDGSYHTVDSSEMAFKIAASLAFKKGAADSYPVILEPVMAVEVTVPEVYVGDIIGDLISRRAKIIGIETDGHSEILKVLIPMTEIVSYSSVLNSMTSGAGVFTSALSSYEEVPEHIAAAILAATKKAA